MAAAGRPLVDDSQKQAGGGTGGGAGGGAGGAGFELTAPQLVHEINSLLDGALRSLRLARRGLVEPAGGAGAGNSLFDLSEIARRLEMVHTALVQLADLVPHPNRSTFPRQAVEEAGPTLREAVRFVVESLRELAEINHVALRISIRDDLGSLPIAKLGVVLHNGVRNAIEACSVCGLAGRRVQIDIQKSRCNNLVLMISDTGRGLPSALTGGTPVPPLMSNFEIDAVPRADGHGHGLEVCRTIVRELGGTMMLMNVPFDGGAVMRVEVPLASLTEP